jgi:hypothetical protein
MFSRRGDTTIDAMPVDASLGYDRQDHPNRADQLVDTGAGGPLEPVYRSGGSVVADTRIISLTATGPDGIVGGGVEGPVDVAVGHVPMTGRVVG